MDTPRVSVPRGEYTAWTERGITEATMQKYGVLQPYAIGSDALRDAVTFVYYDGTTPIGTKTRDLAKEKRTKRKHMYTEGHHNLFGLQVVPNNASTVCIVGGEVDVLSVAQLFPHWCVLGLPGDNNAERLITKNQTFIRSFKKIIVAMDNDRAGLQAEHTVVSLLPAYKTHVVKLSLNDPNDYLQRQQGAVLKAELQSAKPFGVSPLTTDEDVPDYEAKPEVELAYDTGMQQFNMLLGGGLHPTEMLGIAGTTGIGKSALAAQLAYNLALENDIKVAFFCSEMNYMQMFKRLGQIHLGKHYQRVENGKVLANVTKAERRDAEREVAKSVLFSRHQVSDPEELYDISVQGILEQGVRVVFVDVLNDLQGFNSDWKVAAETMLVLKRLADGDVKNNVPAVAVVLICHTKGEDTDSVDINSIKGGSTIRQRLTSLVAFEGERGTEPRTLTMLKYSRNYNLGFTEPVNLSYDSETTRYAESNQDSMGRTNVRQQGGTVGTSKRTLTRTSPKATTVREEAPVTTLQEATDYYRVEPTLGGVPSETRLPQVYAGLSSGRVSELHRSEGEDDSTRPTESTSSPEPEPGSEVNNDADTTASTLLQSYRKGHPSLPEPGTPEFFEYISAKQRRLEQELRLIQPDTVVPETQDTVPTVPPETEPTDTVQETPRELTMKERLAAKRKARKQLYNN